MPLQASRDTFARASIRRAHTHANEAHTLARQALALAEDTRRRALVRPRMFVGLCALCGHACKPTARYCHEHEWAA